MRRRYEVWFLKLMLADGSGAWWFRYLLMNLGKAEGGGCRDSRGGMPLQAWATWFPKEGEPQSMIQGFEQEGLSLGNQPFEIAFGGNRIDDDSCGGRVAIDGHKVSWDLKYRSSFASSMSEVSWVGFSRTPHSDAVFSGEINFDGRSFKGDPLGYGLQGHNCGYRHRNMWTWTHLLAFNPDGSATTFEALEYDIGAGLMFRKALLWHEGVFYKFSKFSESLRDRDSLQWRFKCRNGRNGLSVEVAVDGGGASLHRLPYVKTNCSGTFEVSNNSLAAGTLYLKPYGGDEEVIRANGGAVLEMVGG
jgi:hypothetical protein